VNLLKLYLIVSTVLIFAVSIYVVATEGINWPVIFFGDIVSFDWRSQFNVDFLMHLLLLATWITWRENFTIKGYLFGFLSIFLGGMFGFPYLLYAIYQAGGDPKLVLLGVHARR